MLLVQMPLEMHARAPDGSSRKKATDNIYLQPKRKENKGENMVQFFFRKVLNKDNHEEIKPPIPRKSVRICGCQLQQQACRVSHYSDIRKDIRIIL